MSWWDGRMGTLDFETTHPEPWLARIVTATLALVGGGEPIEVRSWIVNPPIDIPEEAAKIHGIPKEHALREGQDPAFAIDEILDALEEKVARRRLPLIVFNARYDLTVADREARRYARRPLEEIGELLVFDPLVTDRHLDRYRKSRPGGPDTVSSRTLGGMCAHYGIQLDGAHDAENDAIAAARLAWVLAKRGRVISNPRNEFEQAEYENAVREWEEVRGDLPKLIVAQRRWALEQRDDLAAYFRREGLVEKAEMCSREDWPVIPVGAELGLTPAEPEAAPVADIEAEKARLFG